MMIAGEHPLRGRKKEKTGGRPESVGVVRPRFRRLSVRKECFMEKYVIEGGRPLYGEVEIQSAKNAVLPLLAASVLTDERVVIHNCPRIADVLNMAGILSELGCKVHFDGGDLSIESADAANHEIPAALAKELRSSVFMLGSVLSRFGRARIAYPGGCDIGLRPIDLHQKGLRRLGVHIEEGGGYIDCTCGRTVGAEIVLDCPSVGATENIMLASVKAEGKTVIRNAAKEPEIVDLQNFINRMGGKVRGAGSATIVIEGVKKLRGVEYTPIPDRIEAGTFLIACAMCGGSVSLKNARADNLDALLHKLCEISCKIRAIDDKIDIECRERFAAKLIETTPYPGFPTDAQAPVMAVLTVASGTSVFVETIFENRYKHAGELCRMGADIKIEGKVAVVRGVKKLYGANVRATDLRGGAALVVAGLAAEGKTRISDIVHIDRGYESIEQAFSALGAQIRRER